MSYDSWKLATPEQYERGAPEDPESIYRRKLREALACASRANRIHSTRKLRRVLEDLLDCIEEAP